MRSLLITVILLTMSHAGDQPSELKGEAPGMTLKEFKANHKHAECFNRSAFQTMCRVYSGVSFAGVPATSYKGCALAECDWQGILAIFVDGRLVRLTYGVIPGSSTEIIEVLKRKFGEPSERDKTSAKWQNSVGYLLVMEVAVPGANGSVKYVATAVISALNDSGKDKDI
jgi:hypothetical protein